MNYTKELPLKDFTLLVDYNSLTSSDIHLQAIWTIAHNYDEALIIVNKASDLGMIKNCEIIGLIEGNYAIKEGSLLVKQPNHKKEDRIRYYERLREKFAGETDDK